jgi:nucleotide-binding universal stress UspA family protein
MNSTECALELAQAFGARIVLLHCHEKFPRFVAEPNFQKAVSKIIRASEALVEPYKAKMVQGEVEFDVRLLEGSPGNKIPEAARIEGIDLIVMGSRGVSDFAGLLLGSVAHQVLQKAHCPVFIAK